MRCRPCIQCALSLLLLLLLLLLALLARGEPARLAKHCRWWDEALVGQGAHSAGRPLHEVHPVAAQDLLDAGAAPGASSAGPSAAFVGQLLPVMLMRVPDGELGAQLQLLAMRCGELWAAPQLLGKLISCGSGSLQHQQRGALQAQKPTFMGQLSCCLVCDVVSPVPYAVQKLSWLCLGSSHSAVSGPAAW